MRGVRTLCGKVGKGLGSDVLVETPATLPPPPPKLPLKAPRPQGRPKEVVALPGTRGPAGGGSTSWLGPRRIGGVRRCLESFGGNRHQGTLAQLGASPLREPLMFERRWMGEGAGVTTPGLTVRGAGPGIVRGEQDMTLPP